MHVNRLKFKSLLLSSGINQNQIANEIGVSKSVVSSWFSRGVIPDQYVIILGKLFNKNLLEYFDNEDSSETKTKPIKEKSSNCAHYEQRISDLESNLKDKQVIIDLLQDQLNSLRQSAKKEEPA